MMPSFGVSEMIWTTFVAVLLVYVYKVYRRHKRIADILNKIPGPPTLPIIGNGLQIVSKREDVRRRIEGRFNAHGSMFRIWFGPIPTVALSRANQVEVLLNSTKHLNKSSFYSHVEPWLGEGLLLAKGQRWFKHRKLLTPTFHFKILELFHEIILSKTNILIKRLENLAGTGKVFDVYSYISQVTLDVICESALGANIDAQKDQQSEYVKAVYEISKIITYRNRRVWLYPSFLFNLSTWGRKFYKCLEVLSDFTKKIIEERRLYHKTATFSTSSIIDSNEEDVYGTKKRFALLDLLLEAEKSEAKISETAIREEVDTFTFEGHDTTASGISWCLLVLGHHPEFQERIYQELFEIFGGEDRPITLADLAEMKFLERVIKETLRMYPPVPIIGRILDEDTIIGGYKVPAQTDIGIFVYQLHRDPEIFPDPEKFDPDRFLPEASKERHPYAYIPFSAGSRNCIGQRFAMNEEKTILASIIWKYKVKSVEKLENLNPLFELVLKSETGFKVLFEKRR